MHVPKHVAEVLLDTALREYPGDAPVKPATKGQIVAFSGGKDSTAMILAMRERGEAIDGLLVTPTGNELPEVWDHWNRMADMVGAPVIKPR